MEFTHEQITEIISEIDSVSKSVYAYPFYSFLQNYLFLIK